MFFFDDNTYILRAGDPIGERVGTIAREKGMLLMLCDQCASGGGQAAPAPEGSGAEYRPVGEAEGVRVGCFPDLHAALAGNVTDQLITL